MKIFSLNQLPLYTDDFFFRELNDRNRDAIVIFNPIDALIVSPVFMRSRKSLEEHIAFIRDNNIKKAIVVAEDISFLKECSSLEYLMIFPSINSNDFDYSPIYELKNIKWLQCETTYGIKNEKVANIDYAQFKKLKRLGVSGQEGNINVQKAKEITSLCFYEGFPSSKNLDGFIPNESLKSLRIMQSPIQSLKGIEHSSCLTRLELSYNRKLVDISPLNNLSDTLVYLEINMCGKICDFSVLKELHNLEFLILKGSNTLQDISFIKGMPNLKNFELTMNVEDGDLTCCEGLSYVRIKNRKHFSHKDNEFSKDYVEPEQKIPFEAIE